MTRMIPRVIDPDTPSPGEVEVFNRLRDDPATEGWVALHSLDLMNHPQQLQGEIDFVIIVPGRGVLCLEVKAHRYVRRDGTGMWQLGSDPPSARGPFKQASEAMHALKGRLRERRPQLAGVLFWSAVCFTAVDFNLKSEEWHEWQVIDSAALRSRPISNCVVGVLSNATRHAVSSPGGQWFNPSAGEPSAAQCADIANALRPEFEVYQSPKARRRLRDEELRRYTEEQFAALDAMEANPRVIFEGAAGTGKTLLAFESARRGAASGEQVLLCCYNRLLGKWLKKEAAPLVPAVHAGTFHSYLLELAGVRPPPADAQGFWDGELPDLALARILDRGAEGAPFDRLVVDEAQDLLRGPLLDLLDLSVSGGLASGRWHVFGDFERQAIYGSAGSDQLLQARSTSTARFRLSANCRNTPRIAALTGTLAGLQYRRVLRPDDGVEPELDFYEDDAAQQKLLVAYLDEFGREGYGSNEVVVLSRLSKGPSAEYVTVTPWAQRLKPADTAGGGDIPYASIHAFKGLEAAAVIVTDIHSVGTDEDQALLYVAITRATERLVILLPRALKPDIARLALR